MLEKTYQPAEIEPRIHDLWIEADAFKAGRPERADSDAYCIVIPPPNVTGSLHMGHALNNTLQDILCRFERMRGKDVLWQPGMDHAGIATQMVVERQMAEAQEPDRRTLGRQKFLEKVWSWKEESGGKIVNQLKRLGASCDWSRERFTMDEGLSEAVLKVFVELYRDGLIYKDKRLVNWDPKFQTAISDLEVLQIEKTGSFKWTDGDDEDPFDGEALAKVLGKDPNGHMFHFRYPLKDDPKRFIVVATTRPETMLGDSGVAVHPDDDRYTDVVGKRIVLPLIGREIPIVADEYSDPEKGTGAVKITPAHDFNDFEVGKRHDLEKINVLDAEGRMIDGFGDTYKGLDRFAARLQIVRDMAALGLLAKIEPTTHTVPHGDRSGVVVEPWLTDQWYVDAETLAKPALAAIKKDDARFVPKNWEKTYFEWLNNIQPWCISRQLWWGHRIPAWYGPKLDAKGLPIEAEFEEFVASSEEEVIELAKEKYPNGIRIEIQPDELRDIEIGPSGSWKAAEPGSERLTAIQLRRDPDVLDTWFSSALWPFSTLGWPDKTPELNRFYPTSTLVTGFDIIFFWIARMMMMGLHFMKQVPFHDIYIHALVRDERGQKMSKTKGNVMDPLDIIDGTTLADLIAKRTSNLTDKSDVKRIEKATRSDYPKGIQAYGADALRFTLAAMAAQGRDIKLSMQRVEGYRNFATKIWNAARFAEMNECVRQVDFDPAQVKAPLNRWIVGETEKAAAAVTSGIQEYRFNDASNAAYEFTWGVFCDWYLELIKTILSSNDEDAKAETRATTAWVLDQILKILHPFMPFMTEELWAHMVAHGQQRSNLLALSSWPQLSGLTAPDVEAEIGWVVNVISEIRSVRAEMNVPAGAKIDLVVIASDKDVPDRFASHADTIKRMARLDNVSFAKAPPKGAALIVIDDATLALPLAGVIDMDAERTRLEREIAKADKDRKKAEGWLANEANVAKSPPHVVELNKDRVQENQARIEQLKVALKRIDS
jgi:valyl-tRNA synthetase